MSKYDRKKLNNGDNLNVKLGPYGSASNAIVGSLLNKPTQVVRGEVTIDWYPSNDNSNYGTQILRHTRDNTINIYFRAKKGSVDNWSEWISLATKDDLLSIDVKKYASGALSKGAQKEITLTFEPRTGYTRRYFVGELTGTGSNSSLVNVHGSTLSFFAFNTDANITATILCIYTKD